MVTRRAVCLSSWAAAAAAAATSSLARTCHAYAADDDDYDDACANGALTAERAVPGAYENACMSLPIREITIDKTILQIRQQAAGPGATGLAVWNSSLLLARLLPALSVPMTSPSSSSSLSPSTTTIVELGCGPGLASLAAALQWPNAKVVATDGNPAVVELAKQNIVANDAVFSMQTGNEESRVQARVLPWGLLNVDDDLQDTAGLILGSDLTYNAGSWPLLAETMAALLRPGGIVVYLSLGHAGFNVQAEVDGFLAVAKGQGLVAKQATDVDWPLRDDADPVALLRQSCRSTQERRILDSGGARVTFLQKKVRRKLST